MNVLFDLCKALNDSGIGTAIRESIWVFPIIETAHVLGITLLVGTVALFDLRLLGVLFRTYPVSKLAREVLPWTWAGFAVMFVSGFLLFWAEAAKSYANPAFRAKLILMILVGLNPLLFHCTIFRKVGGWDISDCTPARAKIAGFCSLFLWSGIIVTGRAIAYFQ